MTVASHAELEELRTLDALNREVDSLREECLRETRVMESVRQALEVRVRVSVNRHEEPCRPSGTPTSP